MIRGYLSVLGFIGLVGAGLAQVQDPTRPPAALVVPEPGAAAASPVESGLQTVIMRPGGKSAAVINGQYVEVGGKVGDRRVVRISESEVVLKGESGREVLRMTPAIDKMPSGKSPAAKPKATGTPGR